MEPKGSSPCSQQPANCRCFERVESGPHLSISTLKVRFNIILTIYIQVSQVVSSFRFSDNSNNDSDYTVQGQKLFVVFRHIIEKCFKHKSWILVQYYFMGCTSFLYDDPFQEI
jgi:hypothetical protein